MKPLQTIGKVMLGTLLLITVVDCRRHDKADENEDAAFKQFQIVERYYNDGATDSMEMAAPEVLAFCREREQWTWYYMAWQLWADLYVWDGDYHTGLDKATKMYDDATERKNTFGQAPSEYRRKEQG
jgi:hypothetical protein